MFNFRSQPCRPSHQPTTPAPGSIRDPKPNFAISQYEMEIAKFCTWAANQAGLGCPATRGRHAEYILSMRKKYPQEMRIRFWASRLGVKAA